MTNILSLILSVFSSCIFFFIFFGSEFLMFAYLMIYIGAIIVMFLFVVMVINVKTENSKGFLVDDFFLSSFLNFVLVSFLYFFCSNNFIYVNQIFKLNFELNTLPSETSISTCNKYLYASDISIFGEYTFTHCSFVFIIASLVLLVSMIISISLCITFSKCETKL